MTARKRKHSQLWDDDTTDDNDETTMPSAPSSSSSYHERGAVSHEQAFSSSHAESDEKGIRQLEQKVARLQRARDELVAQVEQYRSLTDARGLGLVEEIEKLEDLRESASCR